MASTANGWQYAVPNDTLVAWPAVSQAVANKLELALAGKNAGSLAVNTTTFTAQTAVQINNVFTAEFNNYLILMTATASATGQLNFQLSNGGTPNATSNYASNTVNIDNATVAGSRSAAGTAINLATLTTGQTTFVIEVFAPSLAAATSFHSRANRFYTDIAGFQSNYLTGVHNVSTAFDGFRLTPSTGNTSGTLRVYGYRNA